MEEHGVAWKSKIWLGGSNIYIYTVYIYIMCIYIYVSYVYLLCFNMFQRNTWDKAFFLDGSKVEHANATNQKFQGFAKLEWNDWVLQ